MKLGAQIPECGRPGGRFQKGGVLTRQEPQAWNLKTGACIPALLLVGWVIWGKSFNFLSLSFPT